MTLNSTLKNTLVLNSLEKEFDHLLRSFLTRCISLYGVHKGYLLKKKNEDIIAVFFILYQIFLYFLLNLRGIYFYRGSLFFLFFSDRILFFFLFFSFSVFYASIKQSIWGCLTPFG